MAIELHIFMQDSRIPNRNAWQQEIEQLQFPVVLESSFDLRQDRGFRPTAYKGRPTGFEFYLDPIADILSSYPHIKSKVGSRDKCATFRWGSDLIECAASLSAAAALTRLTEGIYFYPDDDILYDANDAVEATRKDLNSI